MKTKWNEMKYVIDKVLALKILNSVIHIISIL